MEIREAGRSYMNDKCICGRSRADHEQIRVSYGYEYKCPGAGTVFVLGSNRSFTKVSFDVS